MSTTVPNQAEGRGSVSEAPNLSDGFSDTFTSRYATVAEVILPAAAAIAEPVAAGRR